MNNQQGYSSSTSGHHHHHRQLTYNQLQNGGHHHQQQNQYPQQQMHPGQGQQGQSRRPMSPPLMAPMMGYLGQPQTYANFGLSSTGAPMHGTLALIIIPPGLNPHAAVAANCQMLICGNAPPTPYTPAPNFMPIPQQYNTHHHVMVTPPATGMMHIPPEGFQFLDTSSASLSGVAPQTPGNLNPHAEAFIPTSSRGSSVGRRERGGGDTSLDEGAAAGDNPNASFVTRNRRTPPKRENFNNSGEEDIENGIRSPGYLNLSSGGNGEPDPEVFDGNLSIHASEVSTPTSGRSAGQFDQSWSEEVGENGGQYRPQDSQPPKSSRSYRGRRGRQGH